MKHHHRIPSVLTLLAILLAVLPADTLAAPGQTLLVSVGPMGLQANNESRAAAVSADGYNVAFQSKATNLIPTDTNGWEDIFVLDGTTGETRRVSVGTGGTQSNGPSYNPAISADGRYVAFESAASNLAVGDVPGSDDIFVHDLTTSTTTRISVATTGQPGNLSSRYPAISADGSYVAFYSDASNLVIGDTNGLADIFVRDRITNTTTRVSVATGGAQANDAAFHPSISTDGKYVAFDSYATNLVAGDYNAAGDVFIHDRTTGITTLVSVGPGGVQGNGSSGRASISWDGRYVAFLSSADNLVAGDTNSAGDIFVHDRLTGVTTLVSVATDGTQANGYSVDPFISADGQYVAFSSAANNLVQADTNGKSDVFIHARTTGTTTRVTAAADGVEGNDASWKPSVSANGQYVAFFSAATNLVAGDTNGFMDVFLHQPDHSLPAVIFGTASLPAFDWENPTTRPATLRVQFSKSVLHDGSPHAADSLGNYMLLRAGDNGTFDTSIASPAICDAAHVPAGDDEKIDIGSIVYDPGAFTVSLNIDALFAPLADGKYRLYLCGAASIRDLSGVPLNGGENAAINFMVSQPTFASAVNYVVGTNPSSVAVGDFNGDGKLDLVTGNHAGSSVSVRRNDGDGTFDGSPASTYSMGLTPNSVAVGDFNGDGKLDLVSANFLDSNVSVRWNDGDGTFDNYSATYGMASLPHSVAVGDFNGDGKPDLVTANNGSSNVSVRWNDGDGTFDEHTASYAVGTRPNSVAVGDFNGDGKPDLATANNGSNNVSVLWNDGDGTFDGSPALTYPAGLYTNSVAVGDFNGDGKPDLAAVNNGSHNVSVLWNDGDGTFDGSPTLTYGVGKDPISVAVGDFNGDGKPDLVTANSGNNNVSVLWNHGDGTFDYSARYGVGSLPYPVAVGDFDGQKGPDLAVANYLTNDVSVLLNIRTGNTTTTLTALPESSTYGESVTLTATVTADGPGTPTGEVQFKNGETILGAPVVLTDGQATFTISELPAGTDNLTAEFLANPDYNGSTSSAQTVTVSPAPLTITADDVTKEYGAPLPAFTVSYKGFVLGQDQSVLAGTLSFSTDAAQMSPTGTYTVTPGGLSSTNYVITFVDGTLTVADTTAPTVTSIRRATGAANPTNAASVEFTVSFSEPVTGVGIDDFTLNFTGTIGDPVIEGVPAETSDTYIVTVNTGSGDGTLRLDVAAGASILDLAGNSVTDLPYTGGEVYTIQKTPGAGVYDDVDTNWVYSGTWIAYSGRGPLDSTWHTSSAINDAAEFTFDGGKFKLTYVKARNRGRMDVYVDGSKITTINAYSASLVWQASWTSPTLPSGMHTVRVVHISGTYADIDALTVYDAPPIVGIGSYDDMDSAWIFSSGWATYSGAGPANNTDHYGNVVGSEAQISFHGTRFTFTYVKASNRGNIDVYVDGTKVTTINAKASTTSWQQTWTSPTFPAGDHVVRFVHAGGGTYIDVDAIQIIEGPLTVGPGTYDDNHAAWVFSSGTWTTYSGSGPWNNSTHYSNVIGSEAQLTFNGSGFTFTYVKASNRGDIDVYVDGTKVGTIDASNPTLVWQASWSSPSLTPGVHTVRFVHAGGGTYIDVDAITITP